MFLVIKTPDSYFKKIALFFTNKGLFAVKNKYADEKIINIIRIFVGGVLIYRYWSIGEFVYPFSINGYETYYVTTLLLLSFFLLIGMFTPIVVIALLFTQLYFNNLLATFTLGVDVSAMILLSFLLFPAGKKYSVDEVLYKHVAFIRNLYTFFSFSDKASQIIWAKLISFIAYSLLCIYSVLVHIGKPYWLTGDAGIELLSSTYLSQHPYLFQYLFTESSLSVFIAKTSMQIMVAWYFVLFPFVLIGGIFRKFAIGWMFLFLILSTFVLQLSTLPYLEFCLMIFWFWNFVEPNSNLNVLYDDKCNLCDKTIRFLNIIDFTDTISFLPISKHSDQALTIGTTKEKLYENIYSWNDKTNKIHKGYDFYLHVSKTLPLLWLLYPLVLTFKYLKIGPVLYKYIAKRRIQMFGVCKIPTNTRKKGLIDSKLSHTNNSSNFSFFKAFLMTWLVFAIIYITDLPYSPISNYNLKNITDLKTMRTSQMLGIAPINVFNKEDLNLTYHYFTVTQLYDDKEFLIPYTASDGQRLEMHVSDRVYFGNSLRWRRAKNREASYPPSKHDIKRYFKELVVWSNYYFKKENVKYRFDFYNISPPVQTGKTYKFHNPTHIGSLILDGK